MQSTKLVRGLVALAALTLVANGCGQAPTAVESVGKDGQPRETEDRAAAARSPARADDRVEQAVATAPADRVARGPGKPAPLPPGPGQPLPAGSDEPLPELPLEEAVDSGTSMPQVHFTEEHAETNVVGVGEAFPKLELSNLEGQPHSFGDLLGEKLTIVVFWSGGLPPALEELAGMQSRFLNEFGQQGVAVVGVNVGDDPQLAKELAEQAGAKYPQLTDPDGAAFAKVATERLPRTYLIDTSGQILWFDIEYSRTTRQQLLSAIRYALKPE